MRSRARSAFVFKISEVDAFAIFRELLPLDAVGSEWLSQFDHAVFADRDECAAFATRDRFFVQQLTIQYIAVKTLRLGHVADDDTNRRRAFDAERMLAPSRTRPARLHPRISARIPQAPCPSLRPG
jgi:hypothetical protein